MEQAKKDGKGKQSWKIFAHSYFNFLLIITKIFQLIRSMQKFTSQLSQILFQDTRASLLSLQLLEEANQAPFGNNKITQLSDYESTHLENGKQDICARDYQTQEPMMETSYVVELKNQMIQEIQRQRAGEGYCIEVENEKQLSIQNYLLQENELAIKQSVNLQKKEKIDQDLTNNMINQQQNEVVQSKISQLWCSQETPQGQYAEQIKQNFEVLFQKVYGIIQEIQQRNEKADQTKTQLKIHLKSNAKKELSLNPKVLEISLGKQNDRTQKVEKKRHQTSQSIPTQFDYSNQPYDQISRTRDNLFTEMPKNTRTPMTSRGKKINLMSFTKNFENIPQTKTDAILNSARSERSIKSKGLSLVSTQKKEQGECEGKKPVKITILHKNTKQCVKKKIEINTQSKVEKKTNTLNPLNFFTSRRISNNRII